jgi:H+-translocating NAD(P) transhydrogenase subunit beta
VSATAAIPVAYLVASILFILGLKRLSSPATARSGNLWAALGMGIAVLTTLFMPGMQNVALIVTALVIGSAAGLWGARAVQMTDMPQMVALLNGLGGGAAALVATASFWRASHPQGFFVAAEKASPAEMFGALIGAISLSGSVVAFGKLQGVIRDLAIPQGLQRLINFLLFALCLVSAGVLLAGGSFGWFLALALGVLAFGVTMVIPIGGADMPVVISVLNSCTGLAAAATGFVLHNNALIIAGTLVGASGTLLTMLMCKAMNRSLANVLFSGFGTPAAAPSGGAAKAAPGRPVREVSAEDAALLLANIRSLIIVPGYGMAVAQAQHAVREMADLLAKRGVDVKYAIHPVAGRMPGHMNVLLAEANVPYDQLYDIDQINSQFEQADVALIIGANDVVNPAARTDTASPIYGMPILDADKAKNVIIVKRSLGAGFAGIDNPLYYDPKTLMFFADAKTAISKLNEALKTA